MLKKIKVGPKKKDDSIIKKMPHPAVNFDRDKNEAYLPQDESIESIEYKVDNSTRKERIKRT